MGDGREDAASWPDMLGELCIVCGRHRGYETPYGGTHHMPPVGTGKRGEWQGARLALCGSGTTGCHGLYHAGRLRLRCIEGVWHWKGTNAAGRRAKIWTPCHDDSFWEAIPL